MSDSSSSPRPTWAPLDSRRGAERAPDGGGRAAERASTPVARRRGARETDGRARSSWAKTAPRRPSSPYNDSSSGPESLLLEASSEGAGDERTGAKNFLRMGRSRPSGFSVIDASLLGAWRRPTPHSPVRSAPRSARVAFHAVAHRRGGYGDVGAGRRIRSSRHPAAELRAAAPLHCPLRARLHLGSGWSSRVPSAPESPSTSSPARSRRPSWSNWKPASGSTAQVTSSIATHVAQEYHLNKRGAQLLGVEAEPLIYTSGTHKLTISAVAVRKTPNSNTGIVFYATTSTWADLLCGLGTSCSIATGQATHAPRPARPPRGARARALHLQVRARRSARSSRTCLPPPGRRRLDAPLLPEERT